MDKNPIISEGSRFAELILPVLEEEDTKTDADSENSRTEKNITEEKTFTQESREYSESNDDEKIIIDSKRFAEEDEESSFNVAQDVIQTTAADDKLDVAPEQQKTGSENSVITEELYNLSVITQKIAIETHELHRKVHNDFADRERKYQSDIARYRKIEENSIYDALLTEIADIYSNNAKVVERIEDQNAKKQVTYMFESLEELLESYGVNKQESKAGEHRNPRYCKIVDKVITDNEELHDTVARSKSVGFYSGNRALKKELIDVYVFEKTTINQGDM